MAVVLWWCAVSPTPNLHPTRVTTTPQVVNRHWAGRYCLVPGYVLAWLLLLSGLLATQHWVWVGAFVASCCVTLVPAWLIEFRWGRVWVGWGESGVGGGVDVVQAVELVVVRSGWVQDTSCLFLQPPNNNKLCVLTSCLCCLAIMLCYAVLRTHTLCRYFTAPFALAILHLPAPPKAASLATAAAFVAVNAATLYVFTLRPFAWPDGSTARFMW